MTGRAATVSALALLAASAGAAPTEPGARPLAQPITDLHPIVLHPGVNRVPGFLPGGGEATIVEAWRGNGNAHGHHTWMLLGGASEGHPVGVIGTDGTGDDLVLDTVGDDPFDGERVLGAVRFATARVGGQPATLLIRADLDASASGVLADHVTATVRWFRLSHDDDAIGRPTDEFVKLATVRTTKRYCNAELALRDAAGVLLPADFAGANRVDGCFPGG